MTPTRELKPCPFCGGEASIERYGDARKSTIYTCDNCACSLETGEEWGHGTAWNTRAPDPEAASTIESLTSRAEKAEEEREAALRECEEFGDIGERDGYEKAVQDIDISTGGDGEYRFCTDHDADRHTPDAEAMKARIARRFAEGRAAIEELAQQRRAGKALGHPHYGVLAARCEAAEARALQAEEAMAWRPIESAPRDGTFVDIWADGSRRPNVFWLPAHQAWGQHRWSRSHQVTSVFTTLTPTYWMPLPAPPAGDETSSTTLGGRDE